MYCRSRPQYRSDLGWILGVAFLGTLTRSARPAQGFTYVRCCSAPPASSPHGLAAPGRIVSRRPTCVQLPSACGCFQLAPQRTSTSNPGSMPGTPRTLRAASGGGPSGPSLTAAARGVTGQRAGRDGKPALRSNRKTDEKASEPGSAAVSLRTNVCRHCSHPGRTGTSRFYVRLNPKVDFSEEE